MPNPNSKIVNNNVKKTISHADYSQKLAEQQANEKNNSFAGNEFHRLFGYQQILKKVEKLVRKIKEKLIKENANKYRKKQN